MFCLRALGMYLYLDGFMRRYETMGQRTYIGSGCRLWGTIHRVISPLTNQQSAGGRPLDKLHGRG
jgi:hypothetical protein